MTARSVVQFVGTMCWASLCSDLVANIALVGSKLIDPRECALLMRGVCREWRLAALRVVQLMGGVLSIRDLIVPPMMILKHMSWELSPAIRGTSLVINTLKRKIVDAAHSECIATYTEHVIELFGVRATQEDMCIILSITPRALKRLNVRRLNCARSRFIIYDTVDGVRRCLKHLGGIVALFARRNARIKGRRLSNLQIEYGAAQKQSIYELKRLLGGSMGDGLSAAHKKNLLLVASTIA